MPMEIAPPLGRLGAMMAGRAVFRGGFELRRNAGGGAGRIQQEGKDVNEHHTPFYSGGRGTMDHEHSIRFGRRSHPTGSGQGR